MSSSFPTLPHTFPTTQVTTVDELHHHPDARRLREIYNVGMVQPKHRRMRRCGEVWGGVGRLKFSALCHGLDHNTNNS